MKGQVFKIFSDFYYVETENGTVECKVREILKKKSESVIVGDFVELESYSGSQAFISKVFPRMNFLSRPKVANISLAVIVSALKNPELNFEQLNRYISLCEYHKIKPVLCFNKSDLNNDEQLTQKIKEIYLPLGYDVFFISALYKKGTEKLLELLSGHVSMLCGSSGVGKSSVINVLSNGAVRLETKNVSTKTQRGVHTTRHCEIYKIGLNTSIVDTPGFSNIKFDFILPKDIQKLFREFSEFHNCKFKDCIHLNESGCEVLVNIDKIDNSRYESYKKFLKEAEDYRQKIIYNGKKTESSSKVNKGIEIAKLSESRRAFSRRFMKQNLSKEEE